MTLVMAASTAVVVVAIDPIQTGNHATASETAESRSVTRDGEAITTTTDKGGTIGITGGEGNENAGTIVMTMADGDGTKKIETADMRARADIMMTKPRTRAARARGGMIEVTVCETTAITVTAVTSAGALRGVRHRLDARVHIRARGLAPHPPRLRTRRSPILPRRACSRPRRTRSRMPTGRAPCSNTMSRPRLASPL